MFKILLFEELNNTERFAWEELPYAKHLSVFHEFPQVAHGSSEDIDAKK